MLDIKWIVSNPKEFNKQMDRRGKSIRAEKIIKLYEQENKKKVEVEGIKSQINSLSKKIGKAKKEDRATLISEASILKNKLKEVKELDNFCKDNNVEYIWLK